MGDENPTGICKPQILRNTSYIVTSEEVFVERVVMIISQKKSNFFMTITGKEMNHGEKSPQVYVKPEGITSIVRSSGIYRLSPIKITIDTVGPTRRIVFPVTILSKRGSASLILIMPQKEIKKSTLLDRKGWNMHVKRTCSQAHLPIARRSNGCTKQAVLLTLLPRSSSLPDLLKSVTSLDSLCITVAGPCRSFTGLPY